MREKEVSCIKAVEEAPLQNEEHARVTENDVLEKKIAFINCFYHVSGRNKYPASNKYKRLFYKMKNMFV